MLASKMVPGRSRPIFIHDIGAPHISNRTHEWCLLLVPRFLGKGIWPGNSPDQNPVEDVGDFEAGARLRPPSTSVSELTARLRAALADIPRSAAEAAAGECRRGPRCLALTGEYVGTEYMSGMPDDVAFLALER